MSLAFNKFSGIFLVHILSFAASIHCLSSLVFILLFLRTIILNDTCLTSYSFFFLLNCVQNPCTRKVLGQFPSPNCKETLLIHHVSIFSLTWWLFYIVLVATATEISHPVDDLPPWLHWFVRSTLVQPWSSRLNSVKVIWWCYFRRDCMFLLTVPTWCPGRRVFLRAKYIEVLIPSFNEYVNQSSFDVVSKKEVVIWQYEWLSIAVKTIEVYNTDKGLSSGKHSSGSSSSFTVLGTSFPCLFRWFHL